MLSLSENIPLLQFSEVVNLMFSWQRKRERGIIKVIGHFNNNIFNI